MSSSISANKFSQILKFKNAGEAIKFIKENEIDFVDFNFTDLRGKWHHMTLHAGALSKESFEFGISFDGSSIAGWKEIHESDMILIPDLQKSMMDPFSAQKTIKIICDVSDPKDGKSYSRDPRSIAKLAEKYLRKTGIADDIYMGPEPEFFIFENTRVTTDPYNSSFVIDSVEAPNNSGRDYPEGNMGHRPKVKGGYCPESPLDSLSDIRAEMLTVLQAMGVEVEKHHHEVAPSQCELGIRYASLTDSADNVQLYKHVVHNVANSYGKTATFMPKPIHNDNGSGMHVHQSLWKDNKTAFSGDKYGKLSQTGLYYIGGILKHAKALNAFTNPSTNSYKRLKPGYEAPVYLSYSTYNRSAACRIPHSDDGGKRVEMRFPDPSANPYLAFAAMLMAGIDGIENKIDPGQPIEKNLYNDQEGSLKGLPTLCDSLRAALLSLKDDHEFLLRGEVFTEDVIQAYIRLKEEELEYYESRVHPAEYALYYSV